MGIPLGVQVTLLGLQASRLELGLWTQKSAFREHDLYCHDPTSIEANL